MYVLLNGRDETSPSDDAISTPVAISNNNKNNIKFLFIVTQ